MNRLQRPLIVVALSLAGTGALWLLTRGQIAAGDPAVDIDLESRDVVPHGSGQPPLRFAVAPVLSPERTVEDYQELSRYLASRLGQPLRVVQRKTYAEVNGLLRQGTVHLAIICTGAYLQARAEDLALVPIAVPRYPEGPVYHSVLVTRRDRGLDSLASLKGRSFAFSDPLSLSGHIYPVALLLDQGLSPGSFFSRTLFTYSHDGSIRAVLDGIVDAAAVDSLVLDYERRRDPHLGARLRTVASSPPLPVNPVVVPASLDAELRERLKQALILMHGSADGRAALSTLGVLSFEAPEPGAYDAIFELYMRVRRHEEER